MAAWVEDAPGVEPAAMLRLKVVPGARRNEIAGLIGDRLKVRTSAPPEDGKANRAVCALLATAIGVKPRDVELVSGHASREKLVRVAGASAAAITERLGMLF